MLLLKRYHVVSVVVHINPDSAQRMDKGVPFAISIIILQEFAVVEISLQ